MAEEKGFEVRDKRKARLDAESAAGPEGHIKEEAEEKTGTRAEIPGELPPIDFISFIGSLGGTALIHLGEKFMPGQPEGPKDPAAAKQIIDLLDLIRTKTKGNLESEEAEMLDSLLYNLRVRYLRETGRK